MNSSTSVFQSILPENFIWMFIKGINESQLIWARLFWSSFLIFLKQNLSTIIIILSVLLVVSIIMAIIGQWWLLGKVLYNYIYFGILLVVGLIWGSDVFLSDFFHEICTLILYPICYFIVGLILNSTGLHKKY